MQGEINLTMSLANRISRYFVLCGAAKEDDREVLAFMFFQMFALIQQILALIAVAVALSSFPQVTAFAICFISVKRYAGGAHIDKHWACLCASTGLAAAVCLLCKLVALPPYIAVGASTVTLALVLLRAPIIHPNNPKPERRRKIMRKTSIVIAAVQCVLIAAGSFVWTAMALPASLGGLAAAITLVMPVPEYTIILWGSLHKTTEQENAVRH
jgi:accessory gene regulator protein AgrB